MLLRIEELFLFLLTIYLFSLLKMAWWWFALLFLAPDIAMVGYLVSPKVGAAIYNAFHNRVICVVLYIVGGVAGVPLLQLAGVILFAHISLDRVMGYGLKYGDKFNHTHLDEGNA
jgi:hypothetical protein